MLVGHVSASLKGSVPPFLKTKAKGTSSPVVEFFYLFLSQFVHSCRGVCISDMIPFYLGKFFRQTRASEDISNKVRSRDLSQFFILAD